MERHLRPFVAAHRDGPPVRDLYDRVLAEVERPLLRLVLSATRGNQIKAAAMLGLNRNTLRKKIRELDLPGRARARLMGVDAPPGPEAARQGSPAAAAPRAGAASARGRRRPRSAAARSTAARDGARGWPTCCSGAA